MCHKDGKTKMCHGRLSIGLGNYALKTAIYHIQVKILNINGVSTFFFLGSEMVIYSY